MSRRTRLMSCKERAAFDGLHAVASKNNLRVFAKVKLGDALQVRKSGLSDSDYDYATKAHFDFTITDHRTLPSLSVEVDFVEKKGQDLEQALLKDTICSKLEFPIVRIDFEKYLNADRDFSITEDMVAFLETWLAKDEEAVSVKYSGCQLHFGDCLPDNCAEFAEIASFLIAFHLNDEMNVAPVSVTLQNSWAESGYYSSNLSIGSKYGSATIGSSRIRVSDSLSSVASKLSMALAMSAASRQLQETREHLLGKDGFCRLAFC